MQTKDVTEILKRLGWEPYRDNVGDTFAHYHLPDYIVGIGYDIKNYGESGKEFRLSAKLTTASYCLAWEKDQSKALRNKTLPPNASLFHLRDELSRKESPSRFI
ncbi:DUF6990 domain-containing protein [Bartonella sp. TT110JLCBS]|uniref:DUF6990 domain-containing protein n=1 Tax=Bartonella sp. TT110JLCBS TaxID=3243578 RepID=UPI0035CEFDC6